MDVLAALERKPSLNLFPIENRLSPRASAALATDAVNRYPYSETPVAVYGDVTGLAEVYAYCEDLAKRFFGARHAGVQFLSGLHTMHTVLTALTPPGGRVLVLAPEDGGHYATVTICRGFGYEVEFLPFDRRTLEIDYAVLAARLSRRPADVIYLDASSILRFIDARALRLAAPDALICLDASHILGLLPVAPQTLVLDGGFDSISGSTHKTFPGPQKGLLVTDSDVVAEKVAARMPFTASSSHSASVGSLAISLEELLPHRTAYAHQVIANARALAGLLAERGFDVAGGAFGHTDTHQVWVHFPEGNTPHEWGRLLTRANIRSTSVVLPSSAAPGLRLGTQELTRWGMTETDMAPVADLLERLLLRGDDAETVAKEVVELARAFPGVAFV
ncbi:serine hydroxymethyltransferase [Streptomyces clavuligerus]|nr:serine hydroxymethyltransferase [Streptomyces clavuligerus]ACJ04032.1 hydroxymethyltransferase [Streptomyces clavuligerus]ANW22448.1 serine hydroxymethyltransferase [Streptomyces clavuligerus]AXU17020.1 serine hydroxymethyltransferase [Streptomyces clavuligerus]AXU17354.1 serine hydroxymethyltransferase [Streptomyces clavuligerus]EDY47599.1 serine hydroxymethyltransferase [Streptomyces clavuligerus]